jgi:hypothetical protein
MYDLLKRVAERTRALEGISEMREAYRGESVPDLVWMAIVLARRRGLMFTGESAVGEAIAVFVARERWIGFVVRDGKTIKYVDSE